MTDTPTPTPTILERARAAWRSITTPQSLLASVLVIGTLWAFQNLSDERLEALVYLVATVTTGGAISAAVAARRRSPSTTARSERRDGFVGDGVLWALAIAGGAVAWAVGWAHRAGLLPLLVLALALSAASGCGANPLAMHVRAATVATSALEGVAPLVRTATEHRIEAECGPASRGDVACVHALRVRMEPHLAAVDVPVLTAREALSVYVATLRLLLEADAGGDVDVLGAVGDLARRLVVAWPELVAALRPLGVELPVPPLLELAAAVIGGAR